jgi:hypothetical protein
VVVSDLLTLLDEVAFGGVDPTTGSMTADAAFPLRETKIAIAAHLGNPVRLLALLTYGTRRRARRHH